MSTYTSIDELKSLSGKRRYRDVEISNPLERGRILKFRIRSLTEAEWSEITAGNYDMQRGGLDGDALQLSDARLISACLVDPDGNPLFHPDRGPKIIQGWDAAIAEPLLREIRTFCNLRGEEPVKNSIDGNGLAESSPDSAPMRNPESSSE